MIYSYFQDIFSAQAATERGASVTLKPDSAELTYKDGTKIVIEKHDRLHYLHTYDNIIVSNSVNGVRSMNELHQILGHCYYDDINKLERVVDGMKEIGIESLMRAQLPTRANSYLPRWTC